jgi:hypothetical protein
LLRKQISKQAISNDTLRCITTDCGLTAARFPVGQNIAVTWTTRTNAGATPDFPRQVKGWFNEVRHFGFNSARLAKGTGHYSQVGVSVVTHSDFLKAEFIFPFQERTLMEV